MTAIVEKVAGRGLLGGIADTWRDLRNIADGKGAQADSTLKRLGHLSPAEEAERKQILARVTELQSVAPAIRMKSGASIVSTVEAANYYMQVYVAHLFRAADDGTLVYVASNRKLLLSPFWTVTSNRGRRGKRVTIQHMASKLIRSILVEKAKMGEPIPFRYDGAGSNRWYLADKIDLFDVMRWAMSKPFREAEWRKHHRVFSEKAATDRRRYGRKHRYKMY